MSGEEILREVRDGVLRLTLNRPEARNALSREMTPRLIDILEDAQADRAIRCLLLTGAGDHFSAGGDIAGFRTTLAMSVEERREHFRSRLDLAARMVEAWLAFDRPIVARVRGAAAGAGLLFALVADIVMADETASFIFAHNRMAVIPDGGVTWLLPRVVGLRQAQRLVLTSAKVDPAEALGLGLVSSVHRAADLDAAVDRMVAALARAPQTATRLTKRLFAQSLDTGARDQLRAERDGIAECVGDDDFAEAVAAFFDKRPASFPSAR